MSRRQRHYIERTDIVGGDNAAKTLTPPAGLLDSLEVLVQWGAAADGHLVLSAEYQDVAGSNPVVVPIASPVAVTGRYALSPIPAKVYAQRVASSDTGATGHVVVALLPHEVS